MCRRPTHKPKEADVDMTPMIDIVFIMLIFFIVTAVFFDQNGIRRMQNRGIVVNQRVNPSPSIWSRTVMSASMANK